MYFDFDSASTLDIPYARKVLEHLIAHPDEHRQTSYGYRTACGTTACIAGTAVLFDPDTAVYWCSDGMMSGDVRVGGQDMDVDDRAAQLLGFNDYDANRLFYCMNDELALDQLAAFIEEAEKVQAQ